MLFGKYAECTVDQLMVIGKYTYLRWIYYNCSMISFNGFILECLGIINEWCIDKPGIKPELHDKLTELKRNKPKGTHKMNFDSRLAKNKKLAKFKYDNKGRYVESKRVMQARNQNKYR